MPQTEGEAGLPAVEEGPRRVQAIIDQQRARAALIPEHRLHAWQRDPIRAGFVCVADPPGATPLPGLCWGCGTFVPDAALIHQHFLDQVAFRLFHA